MGEKINITYDSAEFPVPTANRLNLIRACLFDTGVSSVLAGVSGCKRVATANPRGVREAGPHGLYGGGPSAEMAAIVARALVDRLSDCKLFSTGS
ncbi:hypothetical protein PC128_g7507 [Phytophthora cactorum]|nr:hypothetical protein PC128_g7507 [Phytophthora cactorum]